jgi:hypothetical protein
MKKIFLLSSILLLSAVWAVAQYDNQSSGESKTSADSSATTVEGCLSGASGSYTLTDKSGATYQLTGDTAKLDKHVGHTIQVTGSAMASSAGSMSESADKQQTFNVASFKHISASCSGGMHDDMHKDMHDDMHKDMK